MKGLMVLIVIVGIIASIASKKKEAQAKRRTQGPHPGAPVPGGAPGRSAPMRTGASGAAPATARSVTPSQKPSAPGTSKWPWPSQTGSQQSKTASSAYGGTPRYTHVVTSTLEGGHTHTESSMTGEEACPPPKAAVKQHEAEKPHGEVVGALLGFTPDSVLQGVLFSEILGKPKGLQRK